MHINDIPSGERFPSTTARRSLLSLLLCAAIGVGAAGTVTSASAQAYPQRPIRVIVAAGVGTVGDILARLLSTHMSKSMGQPMIVENIPSAGGIVGTQQLVRAPKDGYTIAVLSNNHVINPSIYKSMPYDTIKDIGPIGNIGSTPLVLVTNPAFAGKDLRELLALAKAKPGTYTYGSAGNGTVLHLAGVLLTSEGNVDIKHIPYSASGQMVTDAMGGQIDMVFLGVASAAQNIQAGKLHAIGVTTKVRSSIMPNVPTLAESGLPNYNFDGWLALAGPAGLPKPIVDRLNAELNAALALKEVRDTMADLGVVINTSTPEAAVQFFQTELDKHTQLAKRSGAVLQ